MSVLALNMPPDDVAHRTRVSMTVSFVVHALLLAWIVTMRAVPNAAVGLTEVTLLDPGDAGAPGAPASAAAPAAPKPSPGTAVSAPQEQHFLRRERSDALAPDPQSSSAVTDQIASRLAALDHSPSAIVVPGATGGPSLAAPPSLAGAGGTGSAPIALSRGGGGSAPLALSRGGGGGGTSLAVSSAAMAAPPQDHAPAGETESSARRTIAGASLAGPIADRPVLSMARPVYPEWAQKEGVEGSVTLYFIVRPDGTVKDDVLVQKTAGFQDFDENAQAALRRWRFEPLHGGRTGEQWGTITFHFRLQTAG